MSLGKRSATQHHKAIEVAREMAQACARPVRAKREKSSRKAVHFRLHLKEVRATDVCAPHETMKCAHVVALCTGSLRLLHQPRSPAARLVSSQVGGRGNDAESSTCRVSPPDDVLMRLRRSMITPHILTPSRTHCTTCCGPLYKSSPARQRSPRATRWIFAEPAAFQVVQFAAMVY